MTYNVDPAGFGVTRRGTSRPRRPRRAPPARSRCRAPGRACTPGSRSPTRLDMIVNGAVVGTLVQRRAGRAAAPRRRTASSTAAWRRSTSPPGDDLRLPALAAPTATSTTSCAAPSPSAPSPTSTPRSAPTTGTGSGATTLARGAASPATLDEPGEARWFKFPVVPGQQATVDLSQPAGRLRRRAVRRHPGGLRPARQRRRPDPAGRPRRRPGRPASATQVPGVPDQRPDDPDDVAEPPSTQFAPRIYAPRIYAPRIYAPRIYAPADLCAADLRAADLRTRLLRARASSPTRRSSDAFSAAQNQTLLAVSANTGTWRRDRVGLDRQHRRLLLRPRPGPRRRRRSTPDAPFQLDRSITGGDGVRGPRRLRGRPVDSAPPRGNAADGDRHRHQQARARRRLAERAGLPAPRSGTLAGAHRRRRRRRRATRPGPGPRGPGRRPLDAAPTPSNLVADAIKEHRRPLPQRATASTS